MSNDTVEIKGEMTLLNVLQLTSPQLGKVRLSLQQKRESMPQLFEGGPLIVDCAGLGEHCNVLDLTALRELVIEQGFIPLGLRHVPEDCHETAKLAGWSILRDGRNPSAATRVERATPKNQEVTAKRVEVIDRPVRSGQQVYHPDSDIVVLQHTSAGSEILAGGSVHVYGSLRGRVLAGILGDTSARIFCQKLEAELVAIAGNYRLLDDIDTNLKGQPAMVWLEGEKLKIAPMF